MHYDPQNIFAKILRREVPATILYEDEAVMAIADREPAAPVHALALPKGEYCSFDDFTKKAGAEEVGRFFASVRKAAHALGLQEGGYRLIMNHGADASQTVFHFHVHILGGRALGGLLPSDARHR